MTQQQYLRLIPIRPQLDTLLDVGTCNIPASQQQALQDVHRELFGSHFNAWCQSCLVTAMKSIFVEFDKYTAQGAPVNLNANG